MYTTMQKSRVFTFTSFTEWDDSIYASLIGKKGIRFIAFGRETYPSTGRPHHQGWIQYANPISTSNKSLGQIGKTLGTKYKIFVMRGSLRQNEKYCSKESTLVKFGDEPKQGDRGDLRDVLKRIQDGVTSAEEILLNDPGYYHMYGRTIERAEDVIVRKRFRTNPAKGYWYYGPTGNGKSHITFENFHPNTHYVKCLEDQWWDGYSGQKTVILNEFRREIKFGELLKLADK